MKYSILLFDADDTLFDFEKAEDFALAETMRIHSFPFDAKMKETYLTINRKLWADFEQGIVSKDDIANQRFTKLFEQYGIHYDGVQFNQEYLEQLGKGNFVFEHAETICKELSKTHVLYLVTNGYAKTQHARFAASVLKPYFKDIFVSEESGYQKPQKEYFEYVEQKIGKIDRNQVLLIGDSLTSDMRGGEVMGYDTCWYNPTHQTNHTDVKVTYEIDDLNTLLELVK